MRRVDPGLPGAHAHRSGAAGPPSRLCGTFARGGRDRALFEADREAAYKQAPADSADHLHAIIALRRPVAGVWVGFRPRALVYGSVADVAHYNVPPILVAGVFNRLRNI